MTKFDPLCNARHAILRSSNVNLDTRTTLRAGVGEAKGKLVDERDKELLSQRVGNRIEYTGHMLLGLLHLDLPIVQILCEQGIVLRHTR